MPWAPGLGCFAVLLEDVLQGQYVPLCRRLFSHRRVLVDRDNSLMSSSRLHPPATRLHNEWHSNRRILGKAVEND